MIAVVSDAPEDVLVATKSRPETPEDRLLRELRDAGFAAGLLSTAQGEYVQGQAFVDITQGTRQPLAVYGRPLVLGTISPHSSGLVVDQWQAVVERARQASVTLRPGLLAESVGGATFIASDGTERRAAILAADLSGEVATVSEGDQDTIADRTRAALRSGARLVVVAVPPSDRTTVIREAGALASDDTLVTVVHLPPTPPKKPATPKPGSRYFAQTAVGFAGAAFDLNTSVASDSTRRPGLVVSIDIAPTILRHLESRVPNVMRGHAVTTTDRTVDQLEESRDRWSAVRSGRLARAVESNFLLGLAVVLLVGLTRPLSTALRLGARLTALSIFGLPAAALVSAQLHPASGNTEGLIIAAIGFAVALALVAVAPVVAPAVLAGASLLAVTADLALNHGDLLAGSVIGPSVATGNRFYGVSNELEPILPALALIVLAVVFREARQRKPIVVVTTYALAALVLAAIVAAGPLGADVGGVVTIAGAFAAGLLVVIDRRPSIKTVAAFGVASVLGLVVLAAVDMALGATSHLANNLRRVGSPQEFFELISRRYELALHVAASPSNLIALVVAVAAVVWAVRHRADLFGRELPRSWLAALIGTVGGGVAGALSNDSGPVLLVNAVAASAAIVIYLSADRARPVPLTSVPGTGETAPASMAEETVTPELAAGRTAR